MQDAGIDLPPFAGFQPIRARVIQNPVVALIPILKAAVNIVFGRAGLEAHERVREIVVDLVVLRRKVIRFRLALWPTSLANSSLWCMWCGIGPMLSKNLHSRFQPPSRCITSRAKQKIARDLDRILQQELAPRRLANEAQAFEFGRCSGPLEALVVERKPAFVDAAAVAAKGVEIVGMQLQSAAGIIKERGTQSGLQPQIPAPSPIASRT